MSYINDIKSITIRANNGALRCNADGYEDSQTLTVRKNGLANFTAIGTRRDEFGLCVCNSIVRRSTVRLSEQQVEQIFGAFNDVLKKQFELNKMSHYCICDALADEFVIRYNDASVFYGMSREGDCAEVDAVYKLLRKCLGIPSLLTFSKVAKPHVMRKPRRNCN